MLVYCRITSMFMRNFRGQDDQDLLRWDFGAQDHLHKMVMSKGGVVVPFWSARGLSKWLQSNGNVS